MKPSKLLTALTLSVFLCGGAAQVLAKGSADAQTVSSAKASAEGLQWRDFDSEVFAQAKRENKLILLDLEAVWCHWCHVMAEETYRDPDVIKALQRKFICVRVDQDSRPDLSNKYEQFGWPATIIFNADGRELLKHAGYINPGEMRKILKETVANADKKGADLLAAQAAVKPAAGADVLNKGQKTDDYSGLLPAVKEKLIAKHKAGYDTKYGGWSSYQKFLDFDSAEYAISRGLAGDKDEAAQARGALDGELNLLDPAFGGLYQYSTDGDWQHPHFEKVMAIQCEGLRLYCQGYMAYGDEKYLQAARSIEAFLSDFLRSPDGAYYTSQDADLKQGEHSGEYFKLGRAERLKEGLPRIDKHIYSRENGLAINALTYLYRATGEKKYLDKAIAAAQWIEANRSLKDSPGGFRHDAEDKAGPYLSDTLAMGRAYLSLYEVTADRSWLAKARLCADFMGRHFQVDNQPGFVTAQPETGSDSRGHGHLVVLAPQPLLDENVMASRFANLLYQYTGAAAYKDYGLRALRFLCQPLVVNQRQIFVAGILLADGENHSLPLHVTITGGKGDAEAAALFARAIRLTPVYKRVEWYDRAEGALPNADTELPELPRAAAFSCGDGRCSRPVYSPEDLVKMVDRLTQAAAGGEAAVR
ncbi:MAG: thioredoxin domain-containing protein [Cyanobacteria bacterium SZAS LIN-3]|nr:thioredoxin domain-containing protein [Cyanobacteria bacterium SZAS LIN-3]